jgi:hypothetical protein
MKVLIVASEPVDEEVVDLLPDDEVEEVRVIAPTLPGSAVRYWLNDTDAALVRAQKVATESVESIDDAGFPVSADPPTDDQPEVSIDDALRDFNPDRVLVLKHSSDEEAYREDSLVEEIQEQTDVPVDVHTVAAGPEEI